MSRDLLIETIIATDKGEVNEPGAAAMSFPPSYSAGSCPEKAGDITINQSILSIASGSGIMKVDRFSIADFDITKKIATLSFTPLAGYTVEVELNGVGQELTNDYTIVGQTLTFIEALNDADVVAVRYAYEA